MSWTPPAFNLLEGNPFAYSEYAVSSISGVEAFHTGINIRDGKHCVVCGASALYALHHAYIIPQIEEWTWQTMKENGFLPETAKSVESESRNGILLCPNHHALFDGFSYYIRWVPEERRFVFINHSRLPVLETYHGQAINLHTGDSRLPFHGAFLFHEMRVRGFWPLCADRSITRPIPWADWINIPAQGGGGGGGHGGRRGSRAGRRGGHGGGRGHNNNTGPGYHLRSHGPSPGPSPSPSRLVLTDPFSDPVALQALKESFAEQPNWKASVREGTT